MGIGNRGWHRPRGADPGLLITPHGDRKLAATVPVADKRGALITPHGDRKRPELVPEGRRHGHLITPHGDRKRRSMAGSY